MKITKKDFEKAKTSLPRLQKAQELVKTWETTIASMGDSIEGLEVTEIETDGPVVKGKRKETKDAPRIHTA